MRGYSERTSTRSRIILAAVEDPQNLYLPGGVIVDASASSEQGEKRLPAGTPLTQDGGTGLYKPWKCTLASGAGTAATALLVDDARLFAIGDPIYVGSTLTSVSDIDYSSGSITLAAAATWTDGSTVAPSNGYRASAKVVGLLSDEYGINLAPQGSEEDTSARLLIRGRVNSDLVLCASALFASIAAGEQPLLSQVQFWNGDTRVA